jgi:hypothetical protein
VDQFPHPGIRHIEAAAFGAVEFRFVAGAMARLDRRDLEDRILPVERIAAAARIASLRNRITSIYFRFPSLVSTL